MKEYKWYHTDDYASPNLTKSSLGVFFYEVLKVGGKIGEIWPFNIRHDRSLVLVSVQLTEEMKIDLETRTRFRFRDPPKIVVS